MQPDLCLLCFNTVVKDFDRSSQNISHTAINPFPNKPLFLGVSRTSLLKTVWEKEKLLVTSNFSFSHNVFYPSGELSAIFIKYKNCHLQTLSVWKRLKFVILERVNPHNTFWRPWETSRLKTLWEKEKLLVTISPLPTVFSAHSKNFLLFSWNLKLSSADSFKIHFGPV